MMVMMMTTMMMMKGVFVTAINKISLFCSSTLRSAVASIHLFAFSSSAHDKFIFATFFHQKSFDKFLKRETLTFETVSKTKFKK